MGVIVIFKVCGSAQGNATGSGVNLYAEVPGAAVLIVAGAQVPEIPLGEVGPKVGAGVVPSQRGPIAEKLGVFIVAEHLVVQLVVSSTTQAFAPTGVSVNTTVWPSFKPETVKLVGAECEPVIGTPPSIV